MAERTEDQGPASGCPHSSVGGDAGAGSEATSDLHDPMAQFALFRLRAEEIMARAREIARRNDLWLDEHADLRRRDGAGGSEGVP